MRLSELLGRRIVSSSGLSLGRIHDVRAELIHGRLRLTGLVAGELGVLERYGIGARKAQTRAKIHGHPVIPWSRVVRVSSEVIVRD